MYASRSVFEPTQMRREFESGTRAVRRRVLWTPTCLGRFKSQAAAASWGHFYLLMTASASTAGAAGHRRHRPVRRAVHVHAVASGSPSRGRSPTPAQPTPATPAPAEQSEPDTHQRSAAANGPTPRVPPRRADPKTMPARACRSPVGTGAGRQEGRRAAVLEPQGGRRPQRARSRSARLSRHGGKVAVFDDTVKNLVALHAHHRHRAGHADARRW